MNILNDNPMNPTPTQRTLISIAEHSDLLESTVGKTIRDKWISHRNRVKFGQLNLAIGQFITCDLEGNVLEAPQKYSDLDFDKDSVNEWSNNITAYKKAKDRILFEGFEIVDISLESSMFDRAVSYKYMLHVFWRDKKTKIWQSSKGIKTIENLVPYNLILKDSKSKELGLCQ